MSAQDSGTCIGGVFLVLWHIGVRQWFRTKRTGVLPETDRLPVARLSYPPLVKDDVYDQEKDNDDA